MDNIILSICIPTHNRKSNLKKIVDSILICESEEYEVLIQDNESNDGTLEMIEMYDEKKIIAYKGSFISPLYYEKARGKYILILLDKDFILGNYLEDFINQLKNREISCGYCSLNRRAYVSNAMNYFTGLDAMLNMGYINMHPSGIFYRRKSFLERWKKEKSRYALEYIPVDMIIETNLPAAAYKSCLISTETREEAGDKKSLTYNQYNCWFYPDTYMERMRVYLQHASLLNLSQDKKEVISRTIIERIFTFLDSVADYKNDKSIMSHYNLEDKVFSHITRRSEIDYYKRYVIHYFREYIFLDKEMKEKIVMNFKEYIGEEVNE